MCKQQVTRIGSRATADPRRKRIAVQTEGGYESRSRPSRTAYVFLDFVWNIPLKFKVAFPPFQCHYSHTLYRDKKKL